MPQFILLMQSHLVYIVQIMSFTQIAIVNKLKSTYNKSAAYTVTSYTKTSPVSQKEAPQVIQRVTLKTSTALLLMTKRACCQAVDICIMCAHVNSLSTRAPCHDQQRLARISLPYHLPACLLLEDSGSSRHQSLPKAHKLAGMQHIARARRIPTNSTGTSRYASSNCWESS